MNDRLDHGAASPAIPRVLALLVHYGPTQLALRCVTCVRASEGVAVRVLVVDHNAVRDPDLERHAEYVHAPENPGFAGGVNRGLREAGDSADLAAFDLVVTLNPDTFVEPDCLLRLAEVLARDERVGIAGPALIDASADEPPRWWNVGSDIRWPQAAPCSRLHGEAVRDSSPREEDVGYVCGALMAIRPGLLAEIGTLPEEYGLYFEDADYCFRARSAWYSCRVVPRAKAYHVGGASFAGRQTEALYYQVRNRFIFSRRWSPARWRGRVARAVFALQAVLRAVGAAARGRRAVASAYLRGLRDGAVFRAP